MVRLRDCALQLLQGAITRPAKGLIKLTNIVRVPLGSANNAVHGDGYTCTRYPAKDSGLVCYDKAARW